MSATPPTSGTVAAVSTDRALELLKDAGLSGYEGKAYLALLAAGEPLNGYEVAKASGVPRSTVYETLGKLVVEEMSQVSPLEVPLKVDVKSGINWAACEAWE